MGLTLLLAYAAGLGVASFQEWSPPLFVPFVATLLWLPLRNSRAGAFLLPLTLLLVGMTMYDLRIAPPDGPRSIRAHASDRPVIVEGRIVSIAPRPDGQWAVDLEAEKVGSHRTFARVGGGVRLYIDEGILAAQPGQQLRFRARLRLPRLYGTPGEFDMPRHLAARGMYVTAFVAQARDVAVLVDSELGPRDHIHRWRRIVASRIEKAVAPDLAPMVKALAVGESSDFSRAQRELLSRGGVSHLFAISGQHLTLVSLFLFLIARFFYTRSETLLLFSPPRRILPFLLLPLLYGYLLLTGAALPTQRAFLGAAAGVLLLLSGRHTPALKLMATVAFAMLIAEPLALFEPSFQLSFAGILGILLVVPRWQPRLSPLPRVARWGADLLLSTIAATIATAPLVFYHFHLLAPAGLVTNLVAVPAVGLGATLLAFTGTLLLPIWSAGADALFQGCAAVLKATLSGVEGIVALPGLGGWKIYAFPFEALAAFILAAAALAPGGSHPRNLCRGGLLVAGTVLLLLPPPDSKDLSVTALSVGQGDSILLSFPGRRHYLVDGGGSATGTFDTGERLVAPALGRLGVRALEAVILTHDHPDHRQGLLHILENFPVKAFWSAIPQEEMAHEIRYALHRRGIPAVYFAPGWTTVSEKEQEALSLYAPREGSDLNDLSLVLYARSGKQGVLLPGDLEEDGVTRLLREPPPGPVTLLKLPHHGSRRSSPEFLMDALHPQEAFVSVGSGNTFGFPHPEVVEELDRRKIPLSRTDRDGTVRLSSLGSNWERECWRNGLFR